MADPTPLPDAGALRRAERFTRERFVHEGELPEDALAHGSARRRALDAALAELDAGLKAPSVAWRREYSLLLGLERVLSEDEPRLADGTLLNPHQVDALSGTLTALMAEVQSRSANGNGRAAAAPVEEEPVELASVAIPGEEELERSPALVAVEKDPLAGRAQRQDPVEAAGVEEVDVGREGVLVEALSTVAEGCECGCEGSRHELYSRC